MSFRTLSPLPRCRILGADSGGRVAKRCLEKKGSREVKSRNHSCVGLELSSAFAYRSSQNDAWPRAAPSSVFDMIAGLRVQDGDA